MLVHDEQNVAAEKGVCVSSKLLRNTWLQALREIRNPQSLRLSHTIIIFQMHKLDIKQKGIRKYWNCKTMKWKCRDLFNHNLLKTSIIVLKKTSVPVLVPFNDYLSNA
jgi:hypothetical protein